MTTDHSFNDYKPFSNGTLTLGFCGYYLFSIHFTSNLSYLPLIYLFTSNSPYLPYFSIN